MWKRLIIETSDQTIVRQQKEAREIVKTAAVQAELTRQKSKIAGDKDGI